MEWTKSRPTKIGFYWFQNDRLDSRVVKVWGFEDEALYVAYPGSDCDSRLHETDGEWFGPIQPPAQPSIPNTAYRKVVTGSEVVPGQRTKTVRWFLVLDCGHCVERWRKVGASMPGHTTCPYCLAKMKIDFRYAPPNVFGIRPINVFKETCDYYFDKEMEELIAELRDQVHKERLAIGFNIITLEALIAQEEEECRQQS